MPQLRQYNPPSVEPGPRDGLADGVVITRADRHAALRARRTRIAVWAVVVLAILCVAAIWGVPVVLDAIAGTRDARNQQHAAPTPSASESIVTTSPAEAASLVPTFTPTPSITINAVGDIAFVSSVERLMQSSGGEAPIANVADYVGNADLTIGNLETALSIRGTALPDKSFTFRSNPDRSVAALKRAGFDVVSLANNHTRDWGGDALLDTLSSLGAANIRYAGAGVNRAAAAEPALIDVNGATVAYLAYSQIGPANFAATDSSSGTAFTLDLDKVKSAIADADSRADYVVVSFHWGVEKSYTPSERQVTFGRAAIDAGADAVLAHHPHVLQGLEFHNGGMIAYSLGNFVFSPGSDAGRDTMVLSLTLTPDGVSEAVARTAYIHPTGATKLAEGTTAARVGALIQETSSALGTAVTIERDGQFVRLSAK